MRKQFGRSMIEMLAVLAIIGVLSIGGIALYRRAVNNHHANVILDDVNRFAFAIIEKGNYPLEAVIPKGDFKESGIYQLEGYQDAEANQFSITVRDVPKGVCEPLLDKATIEYKVRVNPSANEKGKLYDTLNKDLCTNDTNTMVFYFGDTTDLCNPKEDGYTPCTVNSDCCGGEFCDIPRNDNDGAIPSETGKCKLATSVSREVATMSDGKTWIRTKYGMTWWSAQNWCQALGLTPATRANIGCDGIRKPSICTSGPIKDNVVQNADVWKGGGCWLDKLGNDSAYLLTIETGQIKSNPLHGYNLTRALCH